MTSHLSFLGWQLRRTLWRIIDYWVDAIIAFAQGLAIFFFMPALIGGTLWIVNFWATGCAIGIGCI